VGVIFVDQMSKTYCFQISYCGWSSVYCTSREKSI